jgi:hypothetical protein
MLYSLVKDDILKNKQVKEGGGFVGVPIPFKRLSDYIPVIERGHSIGVLGSTGSGKSRLTRWMFIYTSYKFHKENNYPLKIIYFPLEDSKEKVMRNLICHYLHELYGIYINLQELDSKGDRILPDFVVEKIEEAEEFFKDFEKVVTIVDGVNEPTQIFNYCQEYALRTGKIEKYNIEVNGEVTEQMRYVANDDVHTIVVVDNMSNIDIETGAANEREAIVKFCKTYVRGRLCNFFKFTVVQVLQQDFASERQSFNRDGESIVAKLEPSLAGIGDSKTISRSMHIVLGMFHPARYGLMQYPIPPKREPQATYRLDILGNRFRSLSILKANDSDFGMKLAFNFDAVTENMTELPPMNTPELEAVYQKIKNKNPEKFNKVKIVEVLEDDDEPPF